VAMRHRFAAGGVLLLATVIVGASRLHGQAPLPSSFELEIVPKHFLLHLGEQIRRRPLWVRRLARARKQPPTRARQYH
jgi:hypothetical protein